MRPRNASSQAGFTIIEVLVAVALFAIVVLVVLAPLTGLFGLTQRSGQQISATNAAQQVVEQVRGQWLDQVKYSKACADLTLPAGLTVTTTITNRNVQGTDTGAGATLNTSCAAATAGAPPALRSLTVKAVLTSAAGTEVASSLSIDVARP